MPARPVLAIAWSCSTGHAATRPRHCVGAGTSGSPPEVTGHQRNSPGRVTQPRRRRASRQVPCPQLSSMTGHCPPRPSPSPEYCTRRTRFVRLKLSDRQRHMPSAWPRRRPLRAMVFQRHCPNSGCYRQGIPSPHRSAPRACFQHRPQRFWVPRRQLADCGRCRRRCQRLALCQCGPHSVPRWHRPRLLCQAVPPHRRLPRLHAGAVVQAWGGRSHSQFGASSRTRTWWLH
mmetsp:Transcript_57759/g.161082  ORF Transcript_57759/g.161082 Transcript_57759/m.161082 type:complete len:231 (+) Transcript_57759:149-841(+)